jgi:hypothetical protein
MYVMYIVHFCRYTNHVSVSHIVRANHEVECVSIGPLVVMTSYIHIASRSET